MFKSVYKNPMMEMYQYEYALYLAMSDLFYGVHCTSVYLLKTLSLYYSELSSTGRSGKTAFEKQYTLEEKMERWIKRDVIGKVIFPQMDRCRVNVSIKTRANGSHIFFFSDGIYSFKVALKWDKEKKKVIGLTPIA